MFNTYKAARVISDDYNIAYIVWCLNEHELYDMKVGGPVLFSSTARNVHMRNSQLTPSCRSTRDR